MSYARWMLLLMLLLPAFGQRAPLDDPWKALSFLDGTWQAKATGNGGVASDGTYTFRMELGGHILARHTTSVAACKGPKEFDCEHGDLLYVYDEAPGQPLKAIYFDNEGHVIHYGISVPQAGTAVFLSEGPRPQFRLTYELKAGVMAGKFQMKMPGGTEWRSYLEWSGPKISGMAQ